MRVDRLIILTVLISCKASTPSSTGKYSEDLSIHRPVDTHEEVENSYQTPERLLEPYVPLTGHIKAELDSISKIALEQNKEGRFVDGFVIQVYSGTSRDEAAAARVQMSKLFPKLNPRMSYHQPTFRVKGGKFIDRLEAHRVYKTVREEFQRALLIPERFLLTYE